MAGDGLPTVPKVYLRNNDYIYVFARRDTNPTEVGEKEVIVLGEVKRTGVIRFSPAEPFTMMHLLFKLGTLSPWVDRKNVQILRRGPDDEVQKIKVNIIKILDDGDAKDDVSLQHGDRIIFKARRFHFF